MQCFYNWLYKNGLHLCIGVPGTCFLKRGDDDDGDDDDDDDDDDDGGDDDDDDDL